jgi:hypothetical protein
MVPFARDLDIQYKTAFMLAHKLREAMASSVKALRIGAGTGGRGRRGLFRRPRPSNPGRIDRRLAENQSGRRQVVVAMRERGGRTLAQIFPAVHRRYAQEVAWREDLRRVSNGEQAHGVIMLAMGSAPSLDFCGY